MFEIEYNTLIPISTEVSLWILIPIYIITICVNLSRTQITKLFSTSKITPRKQQENTIISKTQYLTNNYFVLTKSSLNKMKNEFLDSSTGILNIEAAPQEGVPNIPLDPSSMMGGMSTQMITQLIQIVMYTWISSTFEGFLVLKLPFQIPYRMKMITQNGLFGLHVDTSYVSSMCWYFLIIYCGSNILKLFKFNTEGFDIHNQVGMKNMSMNPMAAMNGGGAVGTFKMCAKNLEIVEYDNSCIMETIEDEVINDLGLEIHKKNKSNKPYLAKKKLD